MINDPFVRKVMSALLVLAFTVMCLPAFGVLYVLAATAMLSQPEGPDVLTVIDMYHGFVGLPETISAPLLQSVQAALTVLCFVEGKAVLSWLGRAVFVLVLLGLAASVLAMVLIDPASATQASNISRGVDTLRRLHDAAFYTCTNAITYLGLLGGFTFQATRK